MSRPSAMRSVSFAIVALLVSTCSAVIAGQAAPEERRWLDAPAVVRAGTTFVPMRAVFELLKASVAWDAAAKTVVATREDTSVRLTVGKREMLVNEEQVLLSAAPEMLSGNVMVPLAAVARSMGAEVSYDSAARIVAISHQGKSWSVLVPPSADKPLSTNQAADLLRKELARLWPESGANTWSGLKVVATRGPAIHCRWRDRGALTRAVFVLSRDRRGFASYVAGWGEPEAFIVAQTYSETPMNLVEACKSLRVPPIATGSVLTGLSDMSCVMRAGVKGSFDTKGNLWISHCIPGEIGVVRSKPW